MTSPTVFTVNGRPYRVPARPVVVVCLDGSADEYFDAALARQVMPNFQRFVVTGYRGLARAAMPTFTNVNNLSLVTGAPPAVHGISGNFFYDAGRGEEIMMNSAEFLRAETILAAAARAGRKVAVVTAKDKLRALLSKGLTGIAFSAEKAGDATREHHGIDQVEKLVNQPTPNIYSAEASLYVLRAGVALLRAGLANFLYLSTTDYLQHLHPPEHPEAIDFYAAIDAELGALAGLGAVIGITADHGMNAKHTPNGEPNVCYLESELDRQFGAGARVILPITDPYVVHHGALGSFAVVYLGPAHDPARVREWLEQQPSITEVYDCASAARKLELPADRLGDFVVLSGRNTVLGRTPAYHNLTALAGKLRSHGGRYEEMVPFVLSHPLNSDYAMRATGDTRNFDLYDYVLNGTEP